MELKTVISIIVLITIYALGNKSINGIVNKIGKERRVANSRTQYVKRVLILLWTTVALFSATMISGFGLSDLGLFFGSVFALIGVAFFAQWSILSNVTASIIVFFFFPYRVGDFVTIVDGENSVEGTVKEISLFHVIMKDSEGDITTYPNALVFQKAVKIRVKQKQKEPTTTVPEVKDFT